MSAAFHPPAALRALTQFFVLLVVLVADAEGRHHVLDCPPFSCGQLRDVSPPFRRRGDPPGCGVPSYELVCTDAKASIRIGSGTYDVVSINYNDSTFWVVEADWGTQSSCLLPHWDRHGFQYGRYGPGRHSIELDPSTSTWATFVNCSKPIENNGIYWPVACLSTDSSFIYVMTGLSSYAAENFEPSCGYLAMTPLGGPGMMVPQPDNTSYPDVVKFMRNGFSLRFPFLFGEGNIRECLAESMR